MLFAGFLNASFMAGMITGVVVGMLLAPKPGKDARGTLKEQFGTVRDRLMRKEQNVPMEASKVGKPGHMEGGEVGSTSRPDYPH